MSIPLHVEPIGESGGICDCCGKETRTIWGYLYSDKSIVSSYFVQWTRREPRTLMQFLLCGVAFAVANQLGNAGYALLAAILIVAGIGYAILIVRGEAV